MDWQHCRGCTCANLKDRSAGASPLFMSSTAMDDFRLSRLESGLYQDIVEGKLQVLAHHPHGLNDVLAVDWAKIVPELPA